MKDAVLIIACIVALAVVAPVAAAGAALFLDLPIAGRSALVGFALGLLLALTVGYAYIYNRLVEADRRRAHERVDSEHDKRRV